MHDSSYEMMGEFVETHLDRHRGTPLEIIDFGAQMIGAEHLTYRTHFDDPAWHYCGVDIVEGRNVDIVLADPYRWSEIPSGSVDLFVSGQAFEHIEYFWVTMFEVVRVLRPGAITALIAPSSGHEHRFPVDCWRFYPDGMTALAEYTQCEVVDTFADWGNGEWGDAILVLRKPEWTEAERTRFDHRAGLQRLMVSHQAISPGRISDEWQYQPQPVRTDTSPLADVMAGTLTRRLTSRRDRRVASEIDEAEFAEQERTERANNQQSRINALTEQRDDLRAQLAVARNAAVTASESTATRRYGRFRATVADAVGERGRAAYKRLRGRS